MPAQDVRVGFIGCGKHATEVLLPAVQQTGMELAGVCDLDRRRAQRITRRFGAFRAYQDLQSMIEEMDLDAVLVCGPPDLHAEAATIALEHGCHVWTEVPPAPTALEAERIAELAAARGLVAQAGLMLRFAPAYQRLRDALAAEEFGRPRAFDAVFWPPALPGHDDPLLFDAVHILDLLYWLLGEIEEVSALHDEERAAISLRTLEGATGVISFAQGVSCPREMVAIAGESAVATVTDRISLTLRHRDREEMVVWQAGALEPGGEASPSHLQGYLPELLHFAAAIGEGAPAEATIGEAAVSMRWLESLQANREV